VKHTLLHDRLDRLAVYRRARLDVHGPGWNSILDSQLGHGGYRRRVENLDGVGYLRAELDYRRRSRFDHFESSLKNPDRNIVRSLADCAARQLRHILHHRSLFEGKRGFAVEGDLDALERTERIDFDCQNPGKAVVSDRCLLRDGDIERLLEHGRNFICYDDGFAGAGGFIFHDDRETYALARQKERGRGHGLLEAQLAALVYEWNDVDSSVALAVHDGTRNEPEALPRVVTARLRGGRDLQNNVSFLSRPDQSRIDQPASVGVDQRLTR